MAIDIDRIKNSVDIVDVIGGYIELKKQGSGYSACCPFHAENSPSFTVSESKQFYHCFHGDTKVITIDGVMKISDMAGGSHKILTNNKQWVDAPFFSLGKQKLLTVNLSRNRVTKTILATPDHDWIVRGRKSKITTENLYIGSRLESASLPKLFSSADKGGICHGIGFGDGTVYKGKYSHVNLHGEKQALSVFFPRAKSITQKEGFKRVYGIGAHIKTMPALSMDNNYLAGFIAGYIATDGCVAKDGTVILNCSSKETLNEVRDICNKIGIFTYGITTQNRMGINNIMSDIHRIHFDSSTMPEFLFVRSYQLKRIQESSKKFSRRRWSVVSVEDNGVTDDVYCCEVKGTESFTLDDHILTGNCFGCGAHGDVVGFIQEYLNIDFIDAVKIIDSNAFDDSMPSTYVKQVKIRLPLNQVKEETVNDVLNGCTEINGHYFAGSSQVLPLINLNGELLSLALLQGEGFDIRFFNKKFMYGTCYIFGALNGQAVLTTDYWQALRLHKEHGVCTVCVFDPHNFNFITSDLKRLGISFQVICNETEDFIQCEKLHIYEVFNQKFGATVSVEDILGE